MAARDSQPESSTAQPGGSIGALSPAPSPASRRPAQRSRGRAKGKAIDAPPETNASQVTLDTLLSMVQTLTEQVTALQTAQTSSERVSPERLSTAGGNDTPPGRPTSLSPTREQSPDPLRMGSLARSGTANFTNGLYSYKTRDIQTLSDGVDPTYEAWSIQLEGKFLEPQFENCSERFWMHYVFGVTSGTAQGHLQTRMSRTTANPF
jgi:hypothetical protein